MIVKFLFMKKNLGPADRFIRIVLGLAFAYLYFGEIVTGTWGIVLIVLSGVFVITSIIGFCPLYAPFGINTCPTRKA